MAKKNEVVVTEEMLELEETLFSPPESTDLFSDFDDVELDVLPDEGSYEVKITAVKPLPNKQLELTVSSEDETIKFTFVWFQTSLKQNLERLKTLFKDEEFAQGTTGKLIGGIVGKTVSVTVKYNGAYVNYNITG